MSKNLHQLNDAFSSKIYRLAYEAVYNIKLYSNVVIKLPLKFSISCYHL